MFQNFFWSSSTNFIAERLWILRLLYSGLNANDDTQIYIRNAIFETLLSFYVSPISSHESKELIVQVIETPSFIVVVVVCLFFSLPPLGVYLSCLSFQVLLPFVVGVLVII